MSDAVFFRCGDCNMQIADVRAHDALYHPARELRARLEQDFTNATQPIADALRLVDLAYDLTWALRLPALDDRLNYGALRDAADVLVRMAQAIRDQP